MINYFVSPVGLQKEKEKKVVNFKIT